MDLVVGATGQVGGRIARRLLGQGRAVRALLREGSAERTAPLLAAGVDAVPGDLRLPRSLVAACEGADTVVCTATTMPHGADDGLRRVDRDGVLALIEAAESAGVRRFVYLSYSGGIDTPSPLHEAKRAAEARLRSSRMETCALRSRLCARATRAATRSRRRSLRSCWRSPPATRFPLRTPRRARWASPSRPSTTI